MPEDYQDKLLESAKPQIDELNTELSRAFADSGFYGRIQDADEVRYSTWNGQTADGRKHTKAVGAQVHPWEGASDARVYLADEYCSWYTALLQGADARSAMNASPVEFTDSAAAAAVQAYMSWLLDSRIAAKWKAELELIQQYAATYGWAGCHVKWNRSYSNKPLVITLESLGQFLGVQDPAEVAALLEAKGDALVEALDSQLSGLDIKETEKKISELGSKGKTTINRPEMEVNHPEIIALKPYYELVFPPETRDIQRARVLFRRDLYTIPEIDEMVATGAWDPKWAEEIKKTAGQYDQWESDWSTLGPQRDVAARSNEWRNMVEVVHAYSRRAGKDGTLGVYQTVFSPSFTRTRGGKESYGSHELIAEACGRYPIHVFTRERTTREVVSSRGIPEIVSTAQSEYKAQVDMMFDRSNLETLPPIKVPQRYGNRIVLGPGKQLSEQRPGDIAWMEPPKKGPDVALANIQQIEQRLDRYFGRAIPDMDPLQAQLKQQQHVDRWFTFKSTLIKTIWGLVQQFADDSEWATVTGTGTGVPRDPEGYNFNLTFDVRDIDGEFTQKKLEAVSAIVLPTDVMGVLDRRKLVEAMLRAIDPSMPKELMVDQAEASQAMFNEVRNEIAQMALGNVPNLKELDPAAQTKLQFVQQIVQSNPKYQELLQSDERFAELLEAFLKNLSMSVQQEQNAQTGRLGVDPNAIG